MRALSDRDCKVIADAVAASCEALGGPSLAARTLGVASSTMTKYAASSEEWRDSVIRLDLAVALDQRTQHPFMLNAMSQLVAGAPAPSFGAITASAVLKLDGVLDDVVREVARAMEDGEFDAAERQAVRERIIAAQRDLARLDAMIVGMQR